MSLLRFESLWVVLAVVVLLLWVWRRRAGARMGAALQRLEQTYLPTTTIDLPLRRAGHMPAVEVTINGQGPFLFAIDSGGQGTARADVSLVEKLGLEIVGRVRAGDGSGRRGPSMDVVRIDTLSFGGATFKGLHAPSRDYNRRMPEGTERIAGMLGFHLFTDCLVTFDYPGKRLRLEHGSLPPADGQEVLDLAGDDHGMPAIDIEVGGRRLTAHVDSGYRGSLMVPSTIVKKLDLGAEPAVIGRARTVVGEFEIKEAVLAGSLTIGRHQIPEPSISFAKIFPRAHIGAEALEGFVVTFDQKHRRVRFSRPAMQS